jgi:hypothetical protein
MPKARQRVYFVFAADGKHRGSTTMRSHQLYQLACQHLGEEYDCRLIEMPASRHSNGLRQWLWVSRLPKGGLYVLTKSCVRWLKPDNARRLQAKADGVCFDHVDAKLSALRVEGADVHLCSSYAQRDALLKMKASGTLGRGSVKLLLHNPDTRLYDIAVPERDAFKAAYIGSRQMAYMPPTIEQALTLFEVRNSDAMQAALKDIPQYGLHYCVRRPEEAGGAVIKPFTKGFTAAVCEANLIVQKDTPDALEFLGEDYPYLVHSHDDAEIIATFERAERGFGSPEWKRGIAIVRGMKQRVSSGAIAQQLRDVLRALA